MPQDKTIKKLDPGLYMVATPIGAARDITLRSLDILTEADVIAAEDTRTARRLFELHGISLRSRPLIAYHDHNGPEARPRLLKALRDGASVAYVSEAGTPLVADPGFQLTQAAISEGFEVFAAPGASAALAALVVSGLPSDRFLFAGFPPGRGEKRSTWLKAQAACGATVVLYESPKRVHGILAVLSETFGSGAQLALCRELTKRHEEVLRGTISDVANAIEGRVLKGEIVLVIGAAEAPVAEGEEIDAALRAALETMKVKDAASEIAANFGLSRRDIYQRALALTKADDT